LKISRPLGVAYSEANGEVVAPLLIPTD